MEENKDYKEMIDPKTGEIVKVESSKVIEEENSPAKLLQRYTDIDLEISKVIIEQDEFIKANKEVFDKINEMNDKIKQFKEEQDKVKVELKNSMREANSKEEIGIRFIAKYTAPFTKKNFDTKKFYEDYAPDTAMYKKYVGVTNVSDSIKITEVKNK